jgi:hypothetical protein
MSLGDGVEGLVEVLISAVSPDINNKDWVYVPGMSGSYTLEDCEAYWLDASASGTITAEYMPVASTPA